MHVEKQRYADITSIRKAVFKGGLHLKPPEKKIEHNL